MELDNGCIRKAWFSELNRHYQQPLYTPHTQIARHLTKIAFKINVLYTMPRAGANSGRRWCINKRMAVLPLTHLNS